MDRPGREAWVALLAALLVGCGPYTELEETRYPLSQVRVAVDGSEAWCRLAPGVSLADLLDLGPVEGFEAGITPAVARELYGPPTRLERSGTATTYVYEKDGSTVEVVEFEELSSVGGPKIKRFDLRVPVSDPPFSGTLPEAIRDVWASDGRRDSVSLASTIRDEPVVQFNLDAGRVQSVSLAWRPQARAANP